MTIRLNTRRIGRFEKSTIAAMEVAISEVPAT